VLWYNLRFPERSLTRIPYGNISGITKDFTCATGLPAFELSFLVMDIPREEQVKDSNELSEIGEFEW